MDIIVCLATVIINVSLLAINIKLYTEIFKQKKIDDRIGKEFNTKK